MSKGFSGGVDLIIWPKLEYLPIVNILDFISKFEGINLKSIENNYNVVDFI